MATEIFDASTTWTAVASSVDVECYGGSGGGMNGVKFDPRFGAGGGAYSKQTGISTTISNNYTVTVGAAGTVNGAGGDSWFSTTGTVLAKGGGISSITAGGAAASGVGSTKYSGGNGGTGGGGSSGGGGGSSAGTAGNGNNASGPTGSVGGAAPTGGFKGGNGGTAGGGAGVQGDAPGGGGGGGGNYFGLGANGRAGRVILTYTASSPPVNSVAPVVSGTAQVGQTLTSTTGTWSNTPTGYSYQWKAAGGNVGTDQNTYVPVVGDIGATITCTVTASNADGPGTPAESAATSAVLPAAPVAAFSGTPLTGPSPLEVVFTDASTNTPTEWVWERLLSGSGHEWEEFHGTPTAQNPTEEFGSGVWDVRLTATNAGGSDTETKLGYITVTEETTSSDQHTAFSWNKPGGWGW